MSQAPASPRSRPVSTQFAFGVADQAIVAMSSVGVVIGFARSLSAEVFGAVALVLLARVFVIELGRAVIATPAQLDIEGPGDGAAPLVAAVLLGSVAGAIGLVVSTALSDARQVLVVVALALPFQVLLEVVRHLLVADRRSADALVLDGAVAFVQSAAVFAAIFTSWSVGPTAHLVVWLGAASLAAVVGSSMVSTAPCSIAGARRWWRATNAVRGGLVRDTMWNHLQRQSVTWFLGGVGSLAVVAGFRGSQTAFRPLALVSSGVRIVAVPSFRRSPEQPAIAPTVVVSALVAFMAGAVLVALVLMPDSLGRAAFGDTWSAMQPLLLPVGLAQLGQAAALGPQVGLIADEATDILARTRSVVVTTLLVGALVAGLLWGAIAAVWVLGLLSLAHVPVWWWVSSSVASTVDVPRTARSLSEVTQ